MRVVMTVSLFALVLGAVSPAHAATKHRRHKKHHHHAHRG